jgi:hypothetical protein
MRWFCEVVETGRVPGCCSGLLLASACARASRARVYVRVLGGAAYTYGVTGVLACAAVVYGAGWGSAFSYCCRRNTPCINLVWYSGDLRGHAITSVGCSCSCLCAIYNVAAALTACAACKEGAAVE